MLPAVERHGDVVGKRDRRVGGCGDVGHDPLAGIRLVGVNLGQEVVGRVEQGVDPDARGGAAVGVDRVFDDVVNLAVEPVEEHAVDHRAGGVDQEVGGDHDRAAVVVGLAELVDRGGRDRVMAVSQRHVGLDVPRAVAARLDLADDEGSPAGKQGRRQGDVSRTARTCRRNRAA